VARRFAPAGVLEFYASTEGDAILVNLSGEKPGCKGRPLPGSAEIRLAAYDIAAGRLREGVDGFAVECRPGEVGMLLTRLRGVVSTSESPLRGLFEPDDARLATGDLFRMDDDGDLWLIDHVQALIRTEHGYVASFPILDALGDVDAIDLAAVYAAPAENTRRSLAIAAVTLRDGRKLDSRSLTRALSALSPAHRPDLVHVVDEIPVTTWYRPNTRALRDAGLPGPGKRVWRLEGDSYVEHRKRSETPAAA
jgi:putative long chain acyl-CoA synthase